MLPLLLIIAASQPDGAPAEEAIPPRLIAGQIFNDDYPAVAIQAQEEGTTKIKLGVSPDGLVEGCEIVETSGSAVLDATSCSLARLRFRYEPARDDKGVALRSTYRTSITWRLQEAEEPALALPAALLPTFTAGALRLAMSADSLGARCAVETDGSAFASMAELSCPSELRAEMPELLQSPGALMTVTTVIPEGAAAPKALPVPGTLVATTESELEIAGDGKITACKDVVLPDATLDLETFCGVNGQGVMAFAPDPAAAVRRGRVRLELYQLGAPTT